MSDEPDHARDESDVGRILEGTYDQIRKVAIGGMAEVYLGRQKNLDRPVAIKRIRSELRHNKDIHDRFEAEARTSAALHHQNLAHVYDFRKTGHDAFIVMEYVDGFDLAEILERTGPLPIDVALMNAVRILDGLAHVHSHGMVHRDLKPDNVRVTLRGEVKIMDFGIVLNPTEERLTMPGVMIGSPHYLSPEQVTGERVDHRADLFAFGIVLYEILTGKRPFFETNSESVYSRIKKGDYIPPENIREGIPAFAVKIIEQCLHVNAARRPHSAQALSQAITGYLVSSHSLAFESRTRQFLMEKKLVSGNPTLIEIDERTSGGVTAPQFFGRLAQPLDNFLWSLRRPAVAVPFVLVVLGIAALAAWLLMSDERVESPAAPVSTTRPTTAKPAARQPRNR